jgi:hypothetical protein
VSLAPALDRALVGLPLQFEESLQVFGFRDSGKQRPLHVSPLLRSHTALTYGRINLPVGHQSFPTELVTCEISPIISIGVFGAVSHLMALK